MASWLQLANAMSQRIVGAIKPLPVETRVVIGWPNPRMVENDLRPNTQTRAIVSIYPLENRSEFRYINQPECIERFDATEIPVVIAPDQVQLGGTLRPGDNIFVVINAKYDFAAQVVMNPSVTGTLQTIADKINASPIGFSGTVAGDILTVAANPTIITDLFTAAYGYGLSKIEVARPNRRVQVTIWAPTPAIRDLVASAVLGSLSAENHYTLEDGSIAYTAYDGGMINDFEQSAGVFLEDLFYEGEYAVYATNRYAIVGAVKEKLTTQAFDGSEIIIHDEILTYEKDQPPHN